MHSTPQRPFVYVYVYVYASTTYPTPSKLARGYTTTAEGDTYVEHSHSQLSSQVAQAHHRALIHQVSLAKRVEVSPACFCQSQHREPALRARAALRLHSALPCVAIIRQAFAKIRRTHDSCAGAKGIFEESSANRAETPSTPKIVDGVLWPTNLYEDGFSTPPQKRSPGTSAVMQRPVERVLARRSYALKLDTDT
eukprot:4439137-Pyramimonas_sp.AAC.1